MMFRRPPKQSLLGEALRTAGRRGEAPSPAAAELRERMADRSMQTFAVCLLVAVVVLAALAALFFFLAGD